MQSISTQANHAYTNLQSYRDLNSRKVNVKIGDPKQEKVQEESKTTNRNFNERSERKTDDTKDILSKMQTESSLMRNRIMGAM